MLLLLPLYLPPLLPLPLQLLLLDDDYSRCFFGLAIRRTWQRSYRMKANPVVLSRRSHANPSQSELFTIADMFKLPLQSRFRPRLSAAHTKGTADQPIQLNASRGSEKTKACCNPEPLKPDPSLLTPLCGNLLILVAKARQATA